MKMAIANGKKQIKIIFIQFTILFSFLQKIGLYIQLYTIETAA